MFFIYIIYLFNIFLFHFKIDRCQCSILYIRKRFSRYSPTTADLNSAEFYLWGYLKTLLCSAAIENEETS